MPCSCEWKGHPVAERQGAARTAQQHVHDQLVGDFQQQVIAVVGAHPLLAARGLAQVVVVPVAHHVDRAVVAPATVPMRVAVVMAGLMVLCRRTAVLDGFLLALPCLVTPSLLLSPAALFLGDAALLLFVALALLFLLAFALRLFALALLFANLPLRFAGGAVVVPAASVVGHCR